MKKHTFRIVLLGAALAVGAVPAFVFAADEPSKPATPPPTPPTNTERPRFNPADMLNNYRDRFEGLNLTDDQMKKIDGFITTAETEVKKASSSEDRETRRAAFQAIRKLDEDVNSVLTDTQKAQLSKKRTAMFVDRMKSGFEDAKLNLTADQKTKMDAVFADLATQLNALPAPTQGQRDPKRFELMRDAREKANAILTPDQQKLIPAPRGRNRRGNNPPPATGA